MRSKIFALILLLAFASPCFAGNNSVTPGPFDTATGYQSGPTPNGESLSIAVQPGTGSTYYTTDGSTPTNAKTLYTAPFSLPSNATTTIKSVTYSSNGTQNSAINSATFWAPLNFIPDTGTILYGNGVTAPQPWYDNKNQPIQAHGGGIVYDPDTAQYVWLGQNTNAVTTAWAFGPNQYNQPGMVAYTSTNLYNWNPVGPVVPPIPLTAAYTMGGHQLNAAERCHMFRNSSPSTPNHKWVGWCHLASVYDNYLYAAAGVFSGPTSTGPFTWAAAPVLAPGGGTVNDDNVFVDPNNSNKYLVYTHNTVGASFNAGVVYTQLDSATDYMTFTGSETSADGANREGPVLFYNNGRYFLITSATNNYASTAASSVSYKSATTLAGLNGASDTTIFSSAPTINTVAYVAQSTDIFLLNGYTNSFVLMLDWWFPGGGGSADLTKAGYVFWPVTFPTSSTLQTTAPASWNILGTYGAGP